MIKVGLTGGIGSGKSEVARLLATHGALVVDADALARESLAPGSDGLARVVAEFGTGVLHDGPGEQALDRSKLGQIVFADPDRLAALNAIVHPYVARRSREITAAARQDAVVVHDVPLLVENGLQEQYDVVVVVDVSPNVQVSRLTGRRGMSEDQARARMAAQAGRAERLAAADVVVDNSADLESLQARVDELWRGLVRRS